MANEEQIRALKAGSETWNAYRKANPDACYTGRPDLVEADLRGVNLCGANLVRANLLKADLAGANLTGADLTSAFLMHADLTSTEFTNAVLKTADLRQTDLTGADFKGAALNGAQLEKAELRGTHLLGTDLTGAYFYETTMADVDLSDCKGLETCIHSGPSIIDHRTLQRSGPLPLAFLRGVGLPEKLIEYLPSLLDQPIQFYSCFISYSAKDEAFAQRLHADLQNNGIRCWYAPEDMKIGAKILDTLNEAIRLRDRVLLVLSEASIASEWVEDEVTRAFAEERDRKTTVLFPIRLDETVFEASEAWARKLRDNRNIGDFREWKKHDVYEGKLNRLLRDLQVKPS